MDETRSFEGVSVELEIDEEEALHAGSCHLVTLHVNAEKGKHKIFVCLWEGK